MGRFADTAAMCAVGKGPKGSERPLAGLGAPAIVRQAALTVLGRGFLALPPAEALVIVSRSELLRGGKR